MLWMVRAALLLFFSVTVCAALVVLTWWFPKLKLVGLRLTTGADAVVPTKTLTDRVLCEAWMIRASDVVSAETGATNPPHIMHAASIAPLSARRSINCCQNWVSFTSYSFRRCR